MFSTKNSHPDYLQRLNGIISQISHDLKNNLVTIRASAKNIKHYVNNGDSEANINSIDTTVSNIDKKINHSVTILNMAHLFSAAKDDWPADISNFSINYCIKYAIQNYPFSSRKYSSLIKRINPDADFLIKGNKVLVNGIFYCLIKNAVTAMRSSEKGEAAVFLEAGNKHNKVHFKFSEVQRSDESPGYDYLFSLGTPNNSGNGLNFIQNVVKGMNGRVEFRQESNNMLKVTLIFQLKEKFD